MVLRNAVMIAVALLWLGGNREGRAGQAPAAQPAVQQAGSASQSSPQQAGSPQTQSSAPQPTSGQPQEQQTSLGDAARKAREQKKKAPAAKTFTNDDLPAIRAQGISTVGLPPGTEAPAAAAPAGEKKDEAYWRKRFSQLRTRLADTKEELSVLQRELNLAQREWYPDPNKALQEQHSRDEINKKAEQIEDKKKQIADLEQQLSDLQDELRRSGGDPAWGQ